MAKIFITSYLAGTQQKLLEFMSKTDNVQDQILFITTAANVESYTKYMADGIKMLQNLGYKLDFLDITAENELTCYQKIETAKIICVAGGNTFYLLQAIKQKSLLTLLRHKILKDCLYIGESAGGIILSKNIRYCEAMDDKSLAPDLEDDASLNVIDFFPLPHYIEKPFIEPVKEIFEVYKCQINLVPIDNKQVITILNDDIKIY